MATGRNPWQLIIVTTGRQWLDCLAAGQDSITDTHKGLTPQDRAPEEKKGALWVPLSTLKCTCLATLNEQRSSQFRTWAPIKYRLSPQVSSTDSLLKQLPDPCISKESPLKELIRLTFGGYHSGTKIAEEEMGSNPHSSAAATGVPQASRAWSGPQ